ncbi:hypothetical protein Tco_1508061 [Tanacetum coccineum]
MGIMLTIRATNILLQRLPKYIYTLINHYTKAKDIWDNVKMLLEGLELTKEDRESQLYDDFEHFHQNKGETIHDYYVQFVTTVKLNRGLRDTNYDQLHAYLKQHKDTHVPNFKVRLYNVVGAREHKLSTRDMLGAIVYENGPETDMDYNIVLEGRSGYPQHVNKLHSSYMSLQFPLLFIYGQDGYSKDLKMVDPTRSSSDQKRLTMLAFYSYQLHDRANCYNYLSRTGRLFQQYVVTAFCAIEE